MRSRRPPPAGCRSARDLFGVEETLLSAERFAAVWTSLLRSVPRRAPLLEFAGSTRARSEVPTCSAATMSRLRELFAAVLDQERAAEDEQTERAVAARGIGARRRDCWPRRYHLVITNVPVSRPPEARTNPCEPSASGTYSSRPRTTLATVFLERCLSLCRGGRRCQPGACRRTGCSSLATGSFARSCSRRRLGTCSHGLGPGAFETISGEVVKAILLTSEPWQPPPASPSELGEYRWPCPVERCHGRATCRESRISDPKKPISSTWKCGGTIDALARPYSWSTQMDAVLLRQE